MGPGQSSCLLLFFDSLFLEHQARLGVKTRKMAALTRLQQRIKENFHVSIVYTAHV